MRYANLACSLLLLLLPLLVAGCGGGGGGKSRTLVSIAVSPVNPTVSVGATVRLTATGTYSDSSIVDLTQSATWTSSTETVAGVSTAAGSKGTVTGIAPGLAEIVATYGGVSGVTRVTVAGGTSVSDNVMTVTVNGSLCSDASYLNKPCVAVTICNPGSSTCRTVTDILLDTGSFGLRVFKEAIPGLALTQVASGTGALAECVQFADGSALWGPVQRARVQLANEPGVDIPIQVVDASFATRPSVCADADPNREAARFNGILGVGLSAEDCGPLCVSNSFQLYFRCANGTCTSTTVPLLNQVANPVARLPQDNNGLLIQLPEVPLGGAPSATGTLTLGIGTRANNTPGSPTVLPTDASGNFRTVYHGVNSESFVDTGSNGLFFPNAEPALPVCEEPNSAWYCPPVTRALFATAVGATAGSPTKNVAFEIGNLVELANTPNEVFREIGGPTDSFFLGFDWGLPFFLGRSVYIGIEGTPSTLGTGPYVAF